MNPVIISILIGAGTLIVTLISIYTAWIKSDTAGKTKALVFEDKLNEMKSFYENKSKEVDDSIKSLQLTSAKQEQESIGFLRLIDKLDESKASKEIVDSFKNESATLRADIDKRFDRIERILENKLK